VLVTSTQFVSIADSLIRERRRSCRDDAAPRSRSIPNKDLHARLANVPGAAIASAGGICRQDGRVIPGPHDRS
jgi:hypothetical protein